MGASRQKLLLLNIVNISKDIKAPDFFNIITTAGHVDYHTLGRVGRQLSCICEKKMKNLALMIEMTGVLMRLEL